ncbi:MAG: threonine synthase [Myxococcota bacterium]
MTQGLLRKYREFLPVTDRTPIITLHEGDTPLLPIPRLCAQLGIAARVWVKFEGLNPTGSFKDRGMTMAISKAAEQGAKAVLCASTGNTSASAAAYAARAGMRAVVLLPKGKVALGKLSQAIIHGAEVLAVDGNFDEALELARQLSQQYPIELVNSVNPFRIEGQTTAAFEICDELGDAPDHLAIPVGNAGNITAYWLGFQRYLQAGRSTQLPKMQGFQAAGSAPIVLGHTVEHPETVATAIRIGNPASWKQALAARDESGGRIEAVTDDQILAAWQLLARVEGVFCEPASAASFAGILQRNQLEPFRKDERIVCVLTGHGLKDPDRAIAVAPEFRTIRAELAELVRGVFG